MMRRCASPTSPWNATSPAGSSRSSTCCARRTCRATRWHELLALADDETRALWDGLTLGYAESTGHPLLRREIASLYAGLEPDDVLVFAGAEEGIFCLVNVLLGPGDHAVVTWPGYQSLYEIARADRRRRDAPRASRGRRLGGSISTCSGGRSRRRRGSSS